MKRTHTNENPGPWFRALIFATAALVFVLSIFSASPALHAWLHSAEHEVAGALGAAHSSVPNSHDASPLPADDACAVVMFAQGVIPLAVAALMIVVTWRVAAWIRRWAAGFKSLAPAFWLPPLCGPPVS